MITNTKKLYMWYQVNNLKLKRFNKSQISQELGIDRSTVSRYLSISEKDFVSWLESSCKREKKLESYYDYTKSLLEKYNYLSSAQIEDRLKEKYEFFPKVNSKTVFNFVQSIRKEHDIPKLKIKKPRYYEKLAEVPYGSEAQVDFGEMWILNKDEVRVKIYFFAIVLSRSRFKYVSCQTKPFTTKTSIEAHDLAFEYFKGVPKEIIYDQDSVFISDENLGDCILTDKFRQYCDSQPFKHIFCRKSDPESKGKVENVVKYVKYNFLSGRVLHNIELLQEECLSWLQRTGNEKCHSTTLKVPRLEWEIEKESLLPTLQPKLEAVLKEYKTLKDNTIKYCGNIYSLPIGTYKGTNSKILLKEEEKQLIIFDVDIKEIARHEIPSVKGTFVRNTDHRRNKSKSIEENYISLLEKLNNTDSAIKYLQLLRKDKPRYYGDNIKAIIKGIKEMSNDVVKRTLDICLKHQVFNGYDFVEIANTYSIEKEIKSTNIKPLDLKLERNIKPEVSTIGTYEEIFAK